MGFTTGVSCSARFTQIFGRARFRLQPRWFPLSLKQPKKRFIIPISTCGTPIASASCSRPMPLDLTTLDVDLARSISALAVRSGATAEPSAAQGVEIAIDTMDADRIRPFWVAVLGYRNDEGYLTDPLRFGPAVWFQQMDEPRPDRDRFHIDVIVAHDVAEARIAAALAAGGTLVTDRFARSWWVLADADGNEACICTWQDR